MKCPTCGAENEGSNRFCEQCGSRLTPSGEFQPAAAEVAAQPTAAAATCPSCGAAVLPGEAFCDECGASLTNAAPAVASSTANDAPTLFAQSTPASGAAPSGDPSVTCPSCGHQNLPGDRFCDNCGAALGQPAAISAAPSPDAPTMIADPQLPSSATDGQAQPSSPASAASTGAAAAPADIPIENAPSAPAVQAPATPPAADASAAQSQYESDKQRLNEEIERQDKIIAQFEQMQSMFGAAAPAAVTQGLAEARDAKARVEAELGALQPPAPAADPAEVARVTEEIERQDKIIAQFEQMQSMFGAAAPAAVTQGLAEARDAKARAEAELTMLTGTTAPAMPAVPEVPVAPAAPDIQSTAAAAAPPPAAPSITNVTAEPPPMPPTPPSAPASPPASSAAPAVPRLVMDDGKELTLPTDKREIIVGREDPISGIFPEVDLTPYGGESGGVSRQHARLNNDNGQWTLTDLNSTNYTRVDGAKIEPNVAVPIASGAKLQFGRVGLTFQA